MKRLLSFLLILLFAFNSVGSYLVFGVLQEQVRSEVKKRIKQGVPQDQLHTLSLTATDVAQFHWMKPGKEFRFKGMMYDVVRIEKKAGAFLYHCITDTQEAELFEFLDDLVQDYLAHSRKQKNIKELIKNLLKAYYQAKAVVQFSFLEEEAANASSFSQYLPIRWPDILFPPPKQV